MKTKVKEIDQSMVSKKFHDVEPKMQYFYENGLTSLLQPLKIAKYYLSSHFSTYSMKKIQ